MQANQAQGMSMGFSEELRIQEKWLLQKFSWREQQKEVYWNQKSRVKWLQEGERNTSFFHKAAIQHHQGNRMEILKIEEGGIAKTQEELEGTLNSYFANLMKEPEGDKEEAQREVFRHIPKIISDDHNHMLGKPIEMEEVEAVIKQMEKDKSPGPDGFTLNFIHACWDRLKEEVWALVEDSRRTWKILRALKSTFLTLIPK